MRSLLFVPGDSERKLAKGLGAGADALLVDLEDSVSDERKAEARAIAGAFLAANSVAAPALWVRINALATGLADDDLAGVMPGKPAGIMLPKCEGLADVERLAAKLRVAEARNGIADGVTLILPLIAESAAGVLAAASWRGTQRRLAGVTWGSEDLAADLGASRNRHADGRYRGTFRLARSITLLAAASAGVAAVDTVHTDFRDLDGLRRECEEAAIDGFTAKLAIHPAQVPVINEAFTPSPAALAEAEAVVTAFREAGNPGVVGVAGRMLDRPHLRRAERLLARAGRRTAP